MEDKAVVPVPLGCIAVDEYTGYTGMVVEIYEFVTGCDHRKLEPLEMIDGELANAEPMDISQLTAVPDHPRQIIPADVRKPQAPMKALVRDKVTLTQGLVVARVTSLFSGPELLVQPCGLTAKGSPMRPLLLPEIRWQILSVPSEPVMVDEPKATEEEADGKEPVRPTKPGGTANIRQYKR